jgi:transposase
MSAVRRKIRSKCSHMQPISVGEVPAVPGYELEEAFKGHHGHALMVHLASHPTTCIHCPSTDLAKDGEEMRYFTHTPYLCKSVQVFVVRQSYRCAECGGTFSEPLTGLDEARNMSAALVDYIRNHPETPRKKMAREVGVSEGTVQAVLTDYACEIIARRENKLPPCIGVDEVYLSRRKARCVIVDLTTNSHFRLLDNNTEATLKAAFAEYSNLDQVKVVVIDMSHHYRWLIEETFKNATIVNDFFHVVHIADRCREDVRRAAAKDAPRSLRKVLRSRRGFWPSVGEPDSPVGSQLMLFAIDVIFLAQEAYESFRTLFKQARNSQECAGLYDHWEDSLPRELRTHFKPLTRAVNNHRDELFAYADYRLTNSPTEALNRTIKNLHRQMPRAKIETLDHYLIIHAELKRLAQSSQNPQPAPSPAAHTPAVDPSKAACAKRSQSMSARRKAPKKANIDSQSKTKRRRA